MRLIPWHMPEAVITLFPWACFLIAFVDRLYGESKLRGDEIVVREGGLQFMESHLKPRELELMNWAEMSRDPD